MNHPRPERRFHLPESVPRPEALAPETARLLEIAVRQALTDAVRAAGGHLAETPAPEAPGTARAEGAETSGDGYRVPSYADAGRPVAVRLRGAPGRGATGAAGGLGIGAGAGTGGRNLGVGAGRTPTRRSTPAAPAPERPWTERRLAALRTRMGHDYREAVLGRIDADTLVLGSTSLRLVPRYDGTGEEWTIARWLGPGAFYLQSIEPAQVGLAALGGGGAYLVHRVTDDGHLRETGLRVSIREIDPVRHGFLAYTGDLSTIREVTIEARRPRDVRAAAARVVSELQRGLAGAPGSIVSATLKDHLKDLNDDELMQCFEELRKVGKLGETLILVRARGFRDFLRERHVPWDFILANWQPNADDFAAVFAGTLWGGAESYKQVIEFVETLSSSSGWTELWNGLVMAVKHPLITGQEGLRLLRDTFWGRLEQLEFFDAGRFLGQLVVGVLTLPEAIRALPKLATSAVKVVAAFNRIGVAALDRIGLGLRDVIHFLVSLKRVHVTDTGIVLMMSGNDILASGPKVQGTSAIAHGEILEAIRNSPAAKAFTDAEVEGWTKQVQEHLKEPPVKPGAAAGATAAGEAVLTVEALEELVAAAVAELGEVPGMNNSVRGTRLHTIFSRLVQERFPHSGLHLVSETELRAFARLPAGILDMPIKEYVTRTPGLMAYERELSPLFQSRKTREIRLIGDLTPDLVVRAPGQLVVFDLTSVVVREHMAKDLLYTHLLRESGEIARVGESYWLQYGLTKAEITSAHAQSLTKRITFAKALKALLDAKKGISP